MHDLLSAVHGATGITGSEAGNITVDERLDLRESSVLLQPEVEELVWEVLAALLCIAGLRVARAPHVGGHG